MAYCKIIHLVSKMPESKSHTGIVKFFDEVKGYGFIIDDESGDEFFCHKTRRKELIEEGDRVSFNIIDGRKGLNAVDVALYNDN